MLVKITGQAGNDEIGNDAGDKDNKYIDQKNNPTGQITHIPESFLGYFIHDVFKCRFHSCITLCIK
jgi:hypothetical protein